MRLWESFPPMQCFRFSCFPLWFGHFFVLLRIPCSVLSVLLRVCFCLAYPGLEGFRLLDRLHPRTLKSKPSGVFSSVVQCLAPPLHPWEYLGSFSFFRVKTLNP